MQEYRHMLVLFNTHCFCVATMVMQTCLNTACVFWDLVPACVVCQVVLNSAYLKNMLNPVLWWGNSHKKFWYPSNDNENSCQELGHKAWVDTRIIPILRL